MHTQCNFFDFYPIHNLHKEILLPKYKIQQDANNINPILIGSVKISAYEVTIFDTFWNVTMTNPTKILTMKNAIMMMYII